MNTTGRHEVPVVPRAEDILGALERLLGSAEFARAGRLRKVLRFLVEQAGHDDHPGLTEYALGLALFERDPVRYATGDDPVVRVQVGRLRRKLAHYYHAHGQYEAIRFSVPQGAYRVRIEVVPVQVLSVSGVGWLAVQRLQCISLAGEAFTQGVCEELSHVLHELFAGAVVSHTFALNDVLREIASQAVDQASRGYVLEGSVRIEPLRVRTSMRLVDALNGRIHWSARFDRESRHGICTEEELARAIGSALQHYFLQGTST